MATRWGIAILASAIAALFFVAIAANLVPTALRHDFLNIYTGATLAHQGDFARLHDPARQLEVERSIVPSPADVPDVVPFVRSPAYAWLLSPLARLPIRAAFACWAALQLGVLLLCWLWAARRFGPSGLIWSSLFLPTAYGIGTGQDCPLLLLLVIAAFELAERDKWGWSGFAIGLTLLKFHLLMLFPVLMLIDRRWRMFAGYSAAATLQILASLAVGGWAGLENYAHLLLRKDIERLSNSPEMMANIHAIPANLGISAPAVSMVLAVIVAAATIWVSRGAPLWRWFGAAVTGSLLAAPHVYEYDVAMLLAPILLALFASQSRLVRAAAIAAVLPPAYWMTAAGAPWAAGPSLILAAFLGSLALDRTPQEKVATTSAAPAYV